MKKIALIIVLFSNLALAQQASKKFPLQLKDIWASYDYWQQNVYDVAWMNSGKYYSQLVKEGVVKVDISTGKTVDTLVLFKNIPFGDQKFKPYDYSLNNTEDYILFALNPQRIYRHSVAANYYIYNLKSQKLIEVSDKGKQLFATFSPDGKKIAFSRDNNMFVKDLATNKEQQITKDGEVTKIINGISDWVYEEEFAFSKAFFWSPDSKHLAFYRFDESEVKEYNMQMWSNGLYPNDYKFKYPKAGEKNSEIKILLHNIEKSQTTVVLDETGKDSYIPRISWANTNELSIRRMNRLQNDYEIFHYNIKKTNLQPIYKETSATYIDVNDDLIYLDDGSFIFSSEKEGYRQLYLFNKKGKQKKKLTTGNYDITDVYGFNQQTQELYYSSAAISPLERYPYKLNINTMKSEMLVEDKGYNTVTFNKDYSYFMHNNSSINKPLVVKLYKNESTPKQVEVLEDNEKLNDFAQENFSKASFLKIPNGLGDSLNAYRIAPKDFDASGNKKYPVLMYVYGGPGHQTVKNSWLGPNFLWYQYLASQGYVIISVDNRGTGARGTKFKKCTYGKLGELETFDQIAAGKYIAGLTYTDENRLGIWGWSYGGYMSSLCITKGSDVFKMAIAVAPVTNWKYYDSIYTERYLGLPKDNEKGYEENSPINFADSLKGLYLMIHGTGDDNVHFQNAVMMQNALIKANKQFDSFFYPNRNHGIYGGNTRLHLYTMMTEFIKKNL